jgi:hypothetical protein
VNKRCRRFLSCRGPLLKKMEGVPYFKIPPRIGDQGG